MNEILIYEDIGEGFFDDGITAKGIRSALDVFGGDDVTVRINSAGGDAFEGLAIYNVLTEYAGTVNVKIDALAASAASVIAMAGDEVAMAENALIMIHDPFSMAVGTADDMRKMGEILDKVRDSIVTSYMFRATLAQDVIEGMMRDETWLNADESLEHGFINSISKPNQDKVTNKMNFLNRAWIKTEPPEEKIPNDAWRVAINRRRLALTV